MCGSDDWRENAIRFGGERARMFAATPFDRAIQASRGVAADAMVNGTGSYPMDGSVQGHIGRELRSLFDEIVHQPIPDRFTALLQALESKKGDKA